MTTDELAQKVKAYYDSQRPSEDAATRLRLAAEMERAAEAERRARREATPLANRRRRGSSRARRRMLAAAVLTAILAPTAVIAVGAAQRQFSAWTRSAITTRNRPAVIALWFHSEWSDASRTLAPLVERLSGQFRESDVQFVKLDLTDDETKAEAERVAKLLGVERFYVAQNGRTGEVVLIDSASGRRVGELKPSQNFERMYGAVQRATIEQKD